MAPNTRFLTVPREGVAAQLLGFQHLLHHRAHDLAQPIRALGEKLVDGGQRRLSFGLGHGGGSPRRIR
jgi:hypothetical protein